MKKLILIFFCFLLPSFVFSSVEKFVFITDPQTILPLTISSALTIQSQNSSGLGEDVIETTDLTFKSTSATGEFLNSSGNPVSTIMSKNTSNRTFYYRDSNLGEHTITVTLTGRESQKILTTNQKILITNNPSNEDSGFSNTNTVSESTSSAGTIKDFDFDISIGKDKFSSVNNDIIFQAVAKNLKDVSAQNISYLWTLGDGSRKDGQVINHKYKYPGEYNVVLNASFADKHSSARIKVIIISPVLEMNLIPGAIELVNKSDGEINLGDWILESGYQKFIIPKDTIVGKGKKIIFDRGTVNISGQEIYLKDPALKEIAFANSLSTQIKVGESEVIGEKETVISKVSQLTEKNEPKTIVLVKTESTVSNVLESEKVKDDIVPSKVLDIEKNKSAEKASQLATVYVAKPKTRILDNFFNLPKKTFKWFVSLIK